MEGWEVACGHSRRRYRKRRCMREVCVMHEAASVEGYDVGDQQGGSPGLGRKVV
jgi:hypothetical protein